MILTLPRDRFSRAADLQMFATVAWQRSGVYLPATGFDERRMPEDLLSVDKPFAHAAPSVRSMEFRKTNRVAALLMAAAATKLTVVFSVLALFAQ